MAPALTTAPSENDFYAAFGVSPLEAIPSDGFWCYRFASDAGEEIRFSFNTHESSVQTAWLFQGKPACTVVHENASVIRIVDSGKRTVIHVDFLRMDDGLETKLELQVFPELEVRWSSLLV